MRAPTRLQFPTRPGAETPDPGNWAGRGGGEEEHKNDMRSIQGCACNPRQQRRRRRTGCLPAQGLSRRIGIYLSKQPKIVPVNSRMACRANKLRCQAFCGRPAPPFWRKHRRSRICIIPRFSSSQLKVGKAVEALSWQLRADGAAQLGTACLVIIAIDHL